MDRVLKAVRTDPLYSNQQAPVTGKQARYEVARQPMSLQLGPLMTVRVQSTVHTSEIDGPTKSADNAAPGDQKSIDLASLQEQEDPNVMRTGKTAKETNVFPLTDTYNLIKKPVDPESKASGFQVDENR